MALANELRSRGVGRPPLCLSHRRSAPRPQLSTILFSFLSRWRGVVNADRNARLSHADRERLPLGQVPGGDTRPRAWTMAHPGISRRNTQVGQALPRAFSQLSSRAEAGAASPTNEPAGLYRTEVPPAAITTPTLFR